MSVIGISLILSFEDQLCMAKIVNMAIVDVNILDSVTNSTKDGGIEMPKLPQVDSFPSTLTTSKS